MNKELQALIQQYFSNQAKLNGTTFAGGNTFSADLAPTVAQTLMTRVQNSSDFLKKINMRVVKQQSGRVLGLGTSRPIASRTNTNQSDARRKPRQAHDMRKMFEYKCVQTNSDTFLTYEELDAWVEFPDFEQRIMNALIGQIANDTLMVGFNGISAAEETNIDSNPLLQDVNKGWLQIMREASGAHHVSGVTVGEGTTYANLDALVDDHIRHYIHPSYQNSNDMVVVSSRNLVNHKYTDIWAKANQNMQAVAAEQLNVAQHFASRAIEVPSHMPDGTMLITPLSNLSIYNQKDTSRRIVKDMPELNRLETYQSDNVAYAIEDFEACVLVEGISLI